MIEESSELDILYPGENVLVPLRGQNEPESVRVEPFYAPQFGTAAKLMRPLAGVLLGFVSVNGAQVTLRFDGDFDAFMLRLLDAMETAPDALLGLVAYAIRKPTTWFNDVSPDALLDLAGAVFRQNSAFFKRRLQPMLPGQGAAPAQDGATSSQNSTGTGIPAATSTE